jgi:uncharacterized membrane protein YraQ (UPF0718 family)
MPTKAVLSLKNSLYYIKEMLSIMPVILVITALIEAWVPKNTIQSAIGKDAGVKGLVFSFLLGSFSAGPIYAAFPICKTLVKKGASITNLVVILSTWAVVKVPMLVNESKFLGTRFMMIRWILTTVSIFIMAFIISKIVKKDDIPIEEELTTGEALLYVDKNYCIGCGICERALPDSFKVKNKKAVVIKTIKQNTQSEALETIIQRCPAKAIKY